jgi:methionine-rich copper-binding protein CopC
MPFLSPVALWALVFLAFTNLATLTLWRVEVAHHALTKTEHAEQAVKAAQAATARLQMAAELNNQIVAEVTKQEQEIQRLNKEKNDALRKLTVGRPCLSGAAVRVLNSPGQPAGPVPDAGPEPLPADAAFATDTDVGQWIADAQESYDTCRGRLAGIASFYERQP